jgi:hypothetical protein
MGYIIMLVKLGRALGSVVTSWGWPKRRKSMPKQMQTFYWLYIETKKANTLYQDQAQTHTKTLGVFSQARLDKRSSSRLNRSMALTFKALQP